MEKVKLRFEVGVFIAKNEVWSLTTGIGVCSEMRVRLIEVMRPKS